MHLLTRNSAIFIGAAAPALAASILALALGCAACELACPTMAVEVRLPDFPADWAFAEFWELRVEQGGQSSAPLLARPGDSLFLSLPRRSPAYLFCVALLGAGKSLPFGAVWPQQGSVGTEGQAGAALALTASGGLSAAFGSFLERARLDAAAFNLDRFGLEAEARLADPWTLDFTALAQSVADGSFRADSLRESPEKSTAKLCLPLELAGSRLVAASPWETAPAVGEDGSVSLELGYKPRFYFVLGYALCAGLSPEGEPCWTLKPTSEGAGL